MGEKLAAIGHGAKHFFGAKATKEKLKVLSERMRYSGLTRKGDYLALMALLVVVKGSPVGLVSNLWSSVETGRNHYRDAKRHEPDLDARLAQAGVSDDGRRTVMAALRNTAQSADLSVRLSARDWACVQGIYTDLYADAGMCVNF